MPIPKTSSSNIKHVFSPDNISALELRNVQAELVNYRGRDAIKLREDFEQQQAGHAIAIITDSIFKDGIIETAIAGNLHEKAHPDMRGFVGLAFRVGEHGSSFECFFLRPANGRADDQLRRNHATQYISEPDYPWYRLREENPGVYESYTDLVLGEWINIKIVVSATRAQLYVNDAEQPCLIVNDLKRGLSEGKIALWIGAGTVAHFSEIIVRKANQ